MQGMGFACLNGLKAEASKKREMFFCPLSHSPFTWPLSLKKKKKKPFSRRTPSIVYTVHDRFDTTMNPTSSTCGDCRYQGGANKSNTQESWTGNSLLFEDDMPIHLEGKGMGSTHTTRMTTMGTILSTKTFKKVTIPKYDFPPPKGDCELCPAKVYSKRVCRLCLRCRTKCCVHLPPSLY